MKWYAIPTRPDGTERLGTEGVLSGEYKSKEAFLRYRVRPYGQDGMTYVLYTKGNDWYPQGRFTKPVPVMAGGVQVAPDYAGSHLGVE